MSKTTVVIPNYNGIEYIDDCLASLYQGSVVPEIIVVDNGSADESLALVREKYGRAQVISFNENTGFSKAVNAGIRAAETEYVLLLNNDTIADERMVEELEKAMDGAGIAFSAGAKMINLHKPELLDGAGDFYTALGWAFARGKDKDAGACNKPGRIFSACAGAALYRRALFEKVGFFDENHFAYLEDIDIGYRANICGYHNIYVPKAKVRHAGSAVSGSRHNAFKVRLSARNSIYLIYKNMPPVQILINLPFLMAGYAVKTFYFVLKGMGGSYLQGLLAGIKLCGTEEGRRHRVRFKARYLKNYGWIQGQLWANIFKLYFL